MCEDLCEQNKLGKLLEGSVLRLYSKTPQSPDDPDGELIGEMRVDANFQDTAQAWTPNYQPAGKFKFFS